MRILYVIPTMGAGGAERVMSYLVSHFAKQHDVTLLTFDSPDAISFYPLPDNVKLRRLDTLGGFNLQRSMRLLSRPGLLRKAVRSLRPDVIVSFTDTTNITTIVGCLGLNVPVVISERIDPTEHRIGWMKEAARRYTYPLARFIICPTKRVAGYFPQSLQPKIRVIGNPVPIASIKAKPSMPGPDGRMRVIAVGRCSLQKGFDRLIDAFASIEGQYPHWDLAIIGDGPERLKLKARVRQLGLETKISLKGVTSALLPELAASHVMAFPSYYEGFPNALAEGLAAGLPAVAYPGVSGVEELIVDGVTGVLADETQPITGLAKALARLMKDGPLRASLGEAARQHVSRWEPNYVFSRWDDLLFEAVKADETRGFPRRFGADPHYH